MTSRNLLHYSVSSIKAVHQAGGTVLESVVCRSKLDSAVGFGSWTRCFDSEDMRRMI